jgi:hypothetical protein
MIDPTWKRFNAVSQLPGKHLDSGQVRHVLFKELEGFRVFCSLLLDPFDNPGCTQIISNKNYDLII